MLTARGQLRDREMAEQAGVTRFMTKPFANNEVLTAVRDLHAQAAIRRAEVSDADPDAVSVDWTEQAGQG